MDFFGSVGKNIRIYCPVVNLGFSDLYAQPDNFPTVHIFGINSSGVQVELLPSTQMMAFVGEDYRGQFYYDFHIDFSVESGVYLIKFIGYVDSVLTYGFSNLHILRGGLGGGGGSNFGIIPLDLKWYVNFESKIKWSADPLLLTPDLKITIFDPNNEVMGDHNGVSMESTPIDNIYEHSFTPLDIGFHTIIIDDISNELKSSINPLVMAPFNPNEPIRKKTTRGF